MPFRDVERWVEADLIIRPGQHDHGVGDGLELALSGTVVPQDVADRAFQFGECEAVVQGCHHLVGEGAVYAQFCQLAVEQVLVVQGVGDQLRGGDESGRLVHVDSALGVDRAGAEGDGRDVPLAGGAKADDKPARAWGQARLVGVPDHRGVEQGGRFEGVFLREVGADQEAAGLADRPVGQEVSPDLLEAVQEELAGSLVAVTELAHHAAEQPLDLRLGERGQTRDDLLGAVFARRVERPHHDAGIVGLEDDSGAFDFHCGGLAASLHEIARHPFGFDPSGFG